MMRPSTFPYRLSDYTVEIVLQPTTDGDQITYFATVVELLGCDSDGPTPEVARHNLEEAFDLYVSSSLADGVSVPLPRRSLAPRPAAVDVREMIWRELPTVGAA